MSMIGNLENIESEQSATQLDSATSDWANRRGMRLAVGFCLTVWGIVAAVVFLR